MKREYNSNNCLKPSPSPAGARVTFPGPLGRSPAVSFTSGDLRTFRARSLRDVLESSWCTVCPGRRAIHTMSPRPRGAHPWSKGRSRSPQGSLDAFRVNFTLRAGGSARMARPAQPDIALGRGPILSRLSVEVVEPGHWRHTAGAAWWYRAVPWMCASILPPYQTSSAADFSRTDGYPKLRISSQIALFRSPLIPGRQLTAVGFKIPALRVANDDLPDDSLIRLTKATQIRP